MMFYLECLFLFFFNVFSGFFLLVMYCGNCDICHILIQ